MLKYEIFKRKILLEVSKIVSKKFLKNLIARSLDCAKAPEKMAALINSLSCLGEIIDDDAFGEYDDMSTLKGTPRGTFSDIHQFK